MKIRRYSAAALADMKFHLSMLARDAAKKESAVRTHLAVHGQGMSDGILRAWLRRLANAERRSRAYYRAACAAPSR